MGCREEFPHLQELYKTYKPKGLEVISVNLLDKPPVIDKYVKEGKFTFPIVMNGDDYKNGIAGKYGVTAAPTNILLDPNGKVVGKWIGFEPEKMKAAMAKLGVK